MHLITKKQANYCENMPINTCILHESIIMVYLSLSKYELQ